MVLAREELSATSAVPDWSGYDVPKCKSGPNLQLDTYTLVNIGYRRIWVHDHLRLLYRVEVGAVHGDHASTGHGTFQRLYLQHLQVNTYDFIIGHTTVYHHQFCEKGIEERGIPVISFEWVNTKTECEIALL